MVSSEWPEIKRLGIQTRTHKEASNGMLVEAMGRGAQNSLSKICAIELSQAHLGAEKRLGVTRVEGEGGQQFRSGQALRSYPVPQGPLTFYRWEH